MNAEQFVAPQPPAVWRWYVIYCIAMAILYVLVALVGAGLAMVGWGVVNLDIEAKTATDLKIQGVVMACCLPLCLPFAIAPFLQSRPWHWVYGIVMIAAGLTSCCCWPASIPLLIYWLKPETQLFFGRSPQTPSKALS